MAAQESDVGKKRKRRDVTNMDPLELAKQEEIQKNAAIEAKESSQLFTRRLQKSKLKELEMRMKSAAAEGQDTFKIKREMDSVRKQVFTDERKLD